MQKRQYGKNGTELSVIGFGGILVTNETAETSDRVVSKAIDAGINYFDVAPNYGDAQKMLGPALAPYRKDVFLACKTELRTANEARKDLVNSLKLLKTDYFDLYQFHAVTTKKDVDTILGPNGAMEVFEKARKEGLVRYLGFSAHSEEAALALMDAFQFDSVLFPINWAMWHGGDFGKKVQAKAIEQGVDILALKALAKCKIPEGKTSPAKKGWYWPVDSYQEAKRGLNFTLSVPGVVATASPGDEYLFDWILKAESEYTPLKERDHRELIEQAKGINILFDAHNSEWK